MKNLIGIFMVLLMIAISCTSSEKIVETPQLTDYMDTVSYSVGVDIGKSFRLQEMEINPNVMARGLSDAFSDKETAITDEEIQSTLINFRQEFQQKQREIAQRKAQESAVAEEAYLAFDIVCKCSVSTADHHVGLDTVSLGTPHVASSPETADDFIRHHQYVVFVQHCLDFLKVGGRGNHDAPSTHNRLRHERGDGVRIFLENQLLQVVSKPCGKCLF